MTKTIHPSQPKTPIEKRMANFGLEEFAEYYNYLTKALQPLLLGTGGAIALKYGAEQVKTGLGYVTPTLSMGAGRVTEGVGYLAGQAGSMAGQAYENFGYVADVAQKHGGWTAAKATTQVVAAGAKSLVATVLANKTETATVVTLALLLYVGYKYYSKSSELKEAEALLQLTEKSSEMAVNNKSSELASTKEELQRSENKSRILSMASRHKSSQAIKLKQNLALEQYNLQEIQKNLNSTKEDLKLMRRNLELTRGDLELTQNNLTSERYQLQETQKNLELEKRTSKELILSLDCEELGNKLKQDLLGTNPKDNMAKVDELMKLCDQAVVEKIRTDDDTMLTSVYEKVTVITAGRKPNAIAAIKETAEQLLKAMEELSNIQLEKQSFKEHLLESGSGARGDIGR